MDAVFEPWSTSAINLPEHADNVVHTDEGAQAAGFSAAIVAGTTIHAYLTHLPAAAWGDAWLDSGWSELRLKAPVFDADPVDVVAVDTDEGTVIEAQVGGATKSTLLVALEPPVRDEHTVIEQHADLTFDLADGLGTYGTRSGDDLALYAETGRVHPVVWSCIGNRATNTYHVDGPWVHVRSAITHLGRAQADDVVVARSALVDRFDSRAGERVVLDIEISVDGQPVAQVEHESIVRLA